MSESEFETLTFGRLRFQLALFQAPTRRTGVTASEVGPASAEPSAMIARNRLAFGENFTAGHRCEHFHGGDEALLAKQRNCFHKHHGDSLA
jgi:hypothetical protein